MVTRRAMDATCHGINGNGTWSFFLGICYCNQAAFDKYSLICDAICDHDDLSDCECKIGSFAGDLCDQRVCTDNTGQRYCINGDIVEQCGRNLNKKRIYPQCPCLNGGTMMTGSLCVCPNGYSGALCQTTASVLNNDLQSAPVKRNAGFGSAMGPAIAIPALAICMLITWFVCRMRKKARIMRTDSPSLRCQPVNVEMVRHPPEPVLPQLPPFHPLSGSPAPQITVWNEMMINGNAPSSERISQPPPYRETGSSPVPLSSTLDAAPPPSYEEVMRQA